MGAGADGAATIRQQRPVALITGGTRGIGLGIARSLAAAGYDLVLGYNANHAVAAEAREALRAGSAARVECVAGDVADPKTAQALFACVRERFGNRLDVLVHNAGLRLGVTTDSAAAAAYTGGGFEKVHEYYQEVYPRCFKRCIDAALGCEGLRSVVAISAPGCSLLQAPQPMYQAPGQAKAAMEYLVRDYAQRLAPRRIRVNTVVPGATVKTDAYDCFYAKTTVTRESIEAAVEQSPLGRWIEADEIGAFTAGLCADGLSLLTGQTLLADAGEHLWRGRGTVDVDAFTVPTTTGDGHIFV